MLKKGAHYTVFITMLVSLVVATGCVSMNYLKKQEEKAEIEPIQTSEFSPEIQKILVKKLSTLEKFAADDLFVDLIAQVNEENQQLTIKDIDRIDQQWRNESESIEEFISEKTTNDTALALIRFQENFPGFMEIFVTDRKGVIAASTNVTSDYFQADEDWWLRCFNDGKGESYKDTTIDYDQSAQTEGVALYVPIYEKDSKRFQGCIKSFFSITAIYQEIINQGK